jgi:hypothetical protein
VKSFVFVGFFAPLLAAGTGTIVIGSGSDEGSLPLDASHRWWYGSVSAHPGGIMVGVGNPGSGARGLLVVGTDADGIVLLG